jgi:predicted ATP-dependent serine protease
VFVLGFENAATIFSNGKFQEALEHVTQTMEKVKKIEFEKPERTFFFEDTEERLIKRQSVIEKEDVKISTGIMPLDRITRGGLSKGELGIAAATAGRGKSIFLNNIVGHNVKNTAKEIKCLHIQLEGVARQCEDRLEAKILDIPYDKVLKNNIPEQYKNLYRLRQ